MATQTMLEIAREAASIAKDDDSFDDTLGLLIRSCYADLDVSGVLPPIENHPLWPQAVRFYVKAFGWTEPDAERWQNCYNALRASMKHDYSSPMLTDTLEPMIAGTIQTSWQEQPPPRGDDSE